MVWLTDARVVQPVQRTLRSLEHVPILGALEQRGLERGGKVTEKGAMHQLPPEKLDAPRIALGSGWQVVARRRARASRVRSRARPVPLDGARVRRGVHPLRLCARHRKQVGESRHEAQHVSRRILSTLEDVVEVVVCAELDAWARHARAALLSWRARDAREHSLAVRAVMSNVGDTRAPELLGARTPPTFAPDARCAINILG